MFSLQLPNNISILLFGPVEVHVFAPRIGWLDVFDGFCLIIGRYLDSIIIKLRIKKVQILK